MKYLNPSKNFTLFSALLITLVVILTYIGCLNNLFVAEDFTLIFISSQTFSEMWQYAISADRMQVVFLPIAWFLFQIFKLDPAGYHLSSLILHLVVTLMVFHVTSRLSQNKWVGLIAALVFAVYPRHHQPVLWMSAYHYVLATLFGLVCIYSFDRYLTTKQLKWTSLALVSLFLALMTHEVAIILFIVLPLIELIFYLTPRDLRNVLNFRFYYKYIPYLILFFLYFLLTFGGARLFKLSLNQAQERSTSEGFQTEGYQLSGLGVDGVKETVTYLVYLSYPHIPLRSLDPNLLTAILALVTILSSIFLIIKGTPLMRFAVLLMILGILPFALFVPFGNADRYFYLSAVGFSMLMAELTWLGYHKLASYRLGLAKAIAVGLLTLYLVSSFILTQYRITEWGKAGEIASDIVSQVKNQYPTPAPNSTFLFADIPGQYGQAYIFLGGGIRGAVSLAYKEEMEIYRTGDPEVKAFLEKAKPVDNPLPDTYVFLYQNGTLYDRSKTINDLNLLQRETWSY